MTVDSRSVTTGTAAATRDFQRLGDTVEQVTTRASSGVNRVNVSVLDLVKGAAGLSVITSGVQALGSAISALPTAAFDYSKQLEVSQVGMAGILGSMTAINGQQTDYNAALGISQRMIRALNDDALRTAASSSELVNTFQALLAPGLSSRMTLEQIRELTVVGTNAVKSMGMAGGQVVQELRDLVQGGITAGSSTLASALGLKDADIAQAKASSEGLFSFLMERLRGFQASSEAFGGTMQGQLDSLQEAAVRVAAEGMSPLTAAVKQALGETVSLFGTFEAGKDVQLNPQLISTLQGYAETGAQALTIGGQVVAGLWEHREAIGALWIAYKAYNLGTWASEAIKAAQAKAEMGAAARLAAAQSAAEAAGNAQVTLSSREKLAAYLAELQAKQAAAQAEVAAQAAQIATLNATREAITVSRAEAVAKLDASRATIAHSTAELANAQATIASSSASLQAARSAGALSYAMAVARESAASLAVAEAAAAGATATLTAAKKAQSVAMAELAVLGQQQARVQASVAAATTAHAAATAAATTATAALTAGTAAASIGARALGVALTAMGGPIGLAIMAVSALGMWLYKLKGQADDAEKALFSLGRARDAVANGKPIQDRDATRIAAGIEALKDERDELEMRRSRVAQNAAAQARFAAQLEAVNAKIADQQSLLDKGKAAANGAAGGIGDLTLTLTGAEQAWRKANDGTKTSTAAHAEYEQKLGASRLAYENYVKALKAGNAAPERLATAAKEQAEAEKALAVERDKKIKEMGASGAAAQTDALQAQVSAVQQGYKLVQQRTADGLDEVASLRKRDLISEEQEVERRRQLGLEDIAAKVASLQAQRRIMAGKKDSAKELADLDGQLQEQEQVRANLQRKSDRELLEIEERRVTTARKLHGDAVSSAYAEVQALAEKNRVEAEEIQTIGLTREALQRLTQARYDSIIARQQERIAVMQSFDPEGRSRDAIDAEIAKLRELQRARELAGQRFARETIAAQAEAWKSLFADVYSGLTNSLYRSFEQGGKFFQTFWNGIRNTLKTTVLRVAIEGTVGLAAGAAGISTGGVAGNALGLANNASTAYSAYQAATGYSSGFNTAATMLGAGSTAGASAVSLGYANAVGAVGGDAIGALIAANGSWGGVAAGTAGAAGAATAGTAAAGSAAGGTAAAGAAAGASGAASTIAAAAPYAAIAIAALAAFGAFRSKTVSDYGYVGTLSRDQTDIDRYTEIRKGGYLFGGPSYSRSAPEDLPAAQLKPIADATKAVYQVTDDLAKSLGYPVDTIAGYSQTIDISLKDKTAEQALSALQAEYTALGNNLANRVVPGIAQWAKEGEISSVTLARLGTSLVQVNGLLGSMHMRTLDLSAASGDSASKLLDLAGGIDNLKALSSSYYEAMFTDAEKAEDRAKRVMSLVTAAGFDGTVAQTGAAMRAEYRRITDALDVNTEAGRKQRLELMAGAAEFAAYADSLDKTEDAATAAKTAADNAAAAEKALADQRASITTSLLQALGATTLLRRQELLALDPSNRALQMTTWRLEDAKTAQEAYTASLSAAQSALDSAKSSASSAQSAIDSVLQQATGNVTSAVSAVAAAQDRITQLQLAAQQQVERAARAAAQELQSLGKSLLEWTQGAAAQTGQDAAAQTRSARAEYQRLLALAQGGDKDAQAWLTRSADTYLGSAEAVTSGLDYATLRAQVLRDVAALGTRLAATPVPTERDSAPDELAAARAALAAAQAELVKAQAVALQIGAPLAAGIEDLIKKAADARAAQATAQADLVKAQATLDAIKANTAVAAEQTAATAAAIRTTIAAKFDALDTSVDGLLTAAELAPYFRGLASDEQLAAIYREIDTNGDGQISRLEAINAGIGGQAAQAQTAQTTLEAIHAGLRVQADTLGGGLAGWTASIAGALDKHFGALDSTLDGQLTIAELAPYLRGLGTDAQLLAVQRAIDTNGDGVISKTEAVRAASAATSISTAQVASSTASTASGAWATASATQSTASSTASTASSTSSTASGAWATASAAQSTASSTSSTASSTSSTASGVWSTASSAATEASNSHNLWSIASNISTVAYRSGGGYNGLVMQSANRAGTQAWFADGGYTGPGGKWDAAGIVHRGEIVWSQADIARAGGVSIVEAMRLGRLQGYGAGLDMGGARSAFDFAPTLLPIAVAGPGQGAERRTDLSELRAAIDRTNDRLDNIYRRQGFQLMEAERTRRATETLVGDGMEVFWMHAMPVTLPAAPAPVPAPTPEPAPEEAGS